MTPRLTRRAFLAASAALAAAPTLVRAGDVPWLEEIQPRGSGGLASLLVDAEGRPITTVAAWAKRREEIRRWWLDFIQPLKVSRPAIRLEVLKEDRDAGVIRQLVRYENEPGVFLDAYVLKPLDSAGKKLPGVVAMHSTNDETIEQPAGLGKQPEKAFGLHMARRGCVTICPKNFLWTGKPLANGKNDYKGTTAAVLERYKPSTGMAKMLFDAQRAVDALVTLPEVDARRLGCVGHSLGAKEALYLPAFDERIKVSVSSEGGLPMASTNWEALWYLGPRCKEPGFGHDHHEVLSLIAPRPFLLVGGNSADGEKSWPLLEAARPVWELYGKPARMGMFNHKKGHAVPPEAEARIADWLSVYL